MLIAITMFFRYSHGFSILISNNTHYNIDATADNNIIFDCSGYYENVSFDITNNGEIYINGNGCYFRGNMSLYFVKTSSPTNIYISNIIIDNYEELNYNGYSHLNNSKLFNFHTVRSKSIKNSFVANAYLMGIDEVENSSLVNYNPSEAIVTLKNNNFTFVENKFEKIERNGKLFHIQLYPYTWNGMLNIFYTLSLEDYSIVNGEDVEIINDTLNGNMIDIWANSYGMNSFIVVQVNFSNNNTAYYTIQLNRWERTPAPREITLYFNFEKEDLGNIQESDYGALASEPYNGEISCSDFVVASNVEPFVKRNEVCHVYRIDYYINYSISQQGKLCFTNYRLNYIKDSKANDECIDLSVGSYVEKKGTYYPKNLILNWFNQGMLAVYISTVDGYPKLIQNSKNYHIKLYMQCYSTDVYVNVNSDTVLLGVSEGNNYLFGALFYDKLFYRDFGEFVGKEFFIPEDLEHVGENVTIIKEDGSNTVDGNYFIDVTSWFKDGLEVYDVERKEYIKVGNPFSEMNKYFAKVTRNDAGTKYYHLYYTNKTYNAKVYCEDFASYCIMTKWPRKNYGCKNGPCNVLKFEYIDWSWKLARRGYTEDKCGYYSGSWGSEFITRYHASLPQGTYKIYVKHRARILDFDASTTAVGDSNVYIDDNKISDLSFRISCSGSHCTADSGAVLKETTWTGQVSDNVGLGGYAGDCAHTDAIHYYFVMLRTSGNVVNEVTNYTVNRVRLLSINLFPYGFYRGNETGYNQGWKAGNETGWNNGYTAGYDDGYDDGIASSGGIDWRVFFFPALAMFFALLNRSKSKVIRTLGKLMWFATMLVSLGTFIYIDSSAVLIALFSSFGIFSFFYFFFVGYGEIINSLSVIKSWS